jgi:hypothetical protein
MLTGVDLFIAANKKGERAAGERLESILLIPTITLGVEPLPDLNANKQTGELPV